MKELTNKELLNINGGGVGAFLVIGAIIVFAIGVIDGIIRPLTCHS